MGNAFNADQKALSLKENSFPDVGAEPPIESSSFRLRRCPSTLGPSSNQESKRVHPIQVIRRNKVSGRTLSQDDETVVGFVALPQAAWSERFMAQLEFRDIGWQGWKRIEVRGAILFKQSLAPVG
jgi:hypothetical protein